MAEELCILMGCFGRRDEDFVSCAGVENCILVVQPSLYKYEDLMEYMDGCRLFDRPMFDLNAVRHFVHNIWDRYDQPKSKIWPEKKFQLYQKFIIDHRSCGVFIKLAFGEVKKYEPEDKPIHIRGMEDTEEKKTHLSLIRR